ncbi:MAG TPA: BON domain-containing protein [Vicinamibacterales bacterium]|nr:BON domain-containing protein [Vicinamibacterales bacterium]
MTPMRVLQVVCHIVQPETSACWRKFRAYFRDTSRDIRPAVCTSDSVPSGKRLRFASFASAFCAFALNGCAPASGPQQALAVPTVLASAVHAPATPVRVETDLERSIRVQLAKAFSDEPGLKDRDVSFSVDGWDVTLTGDVKTEPERRKANELVMNVPGVKSVANALRVSE